MAFSSNSGGGGGGGAPLSEINVTPMVDVLLVLLIIFMITAPMLQQDIQIDLPQPNNNEEPPKDPPPPINLKVTAGGNVYWNNTPVSDLQLRAQLVILGSKPQDNQAELRIDANDDTLYDVLANLMSEAKSAGVKKIGFQSRR